MMHPGFSGIRTATVLGVITLLLIGTLIAAPPSRAANEVVVVKGTQTDRESLGRDAAEAAYVALGILSMIMDGLPPDVRQDIFDEIAENREDPPPPLTPNYTIRFSPTTMRMDQGNYTWMIVIGSVHVGYFGWDSLSLQGVSQVATIQGLVNAAENLSPFQTVLESFPKRCEPGGEPVEHGPFSARWCGYEHTGAVVAGAMSLGTEVKTVGSAWIATGIPGEETIQAFYRNLNEAVSSSPGVGGYFAGLIASQLDIIEEGIPIYNKTIITATVSDKELNKATSIMRVSSVTIESLDDPSEMTEDAVPDDVEMIDMATLAAMAGGATGAATAGTEATGDAASGSDPSASGGQIPQGCDCSCEAFSKMQNMSKKDRKEMENSPEAMALGMCMAQCMTQWMACAQ